MDSTDVEEAVVGFLDAVEKFNRRFSSEGELKTSLEDALSSRRVGELKVIADGLRLYGISGLRKGELAKRLAAILPDPGYIVESIMDMDEEEWVLFKQVAEEEKVTLAIRAPLPYLGPYTRGLIQAYRQGHELVLIVPDEIKRLYGHMKNTGDLLERDIMTIVNRYALAAVSLYGALEMKKLTEIINTQTGGTMKKAFVEKVLRHRSDIDDQYCLYKGLVIARQFDEHGHKRLGSLLKAREGKPVYVPSQEEFLKYSEARYYEVTPQIKSLKKKLFPLLKDEDRTSDLVDRIHHLLLMEAGIQDIIDSIGDAGVVFNSRSDAEGVIRQVVEVGNNTRLWSNSGYTPDELTGMKAAPSIPLSRIPVDMEEPDSRNSPCPCGSGKKYKHCCGKIH